MTIGHSEIRSVVSAYCRPCLRGIRLNQTVLLLGSNPQMTVVAATPLFETNDRMGRDRVLRADDTSPGEP